MISMMIGGTDVIIETPPNVPVADLILRHLRYFWHDARFQDAEEEEDYDIHNPRVFIRGARGKEFLVYRDQAAAESWKRDGMTPTNSDSMLYFIIQDIPNAENRPGEMTMVCGERTEEIQQLVRDLQWSFQSIQDPCLAA
jgi:hypothetical protein